MLEASELTPYDHVLYPGTTFPETHPDRLRVLGWLRGMQPAPASRCRVLELGCGFGGNLIPMAYNWPDSRFVGIDLSSTAVGEGQRQVGELGLRNIDLRHGDILDVTEALGEFDYIIAHGVYSWVPPQVREKILSIFRSQLAPQGVAYVSYNSHPWSHMRNLTREMMLYHVRGITDTERRIAQARSLLKFLAETATDKAYAAVLREQQTRISEMGDEVFYHDDLNPNFTVFWLYQVVEDAERHGLQYLTDAGFSRPELRAVSEQVIQTLSCIPESEVVAREQYLDFIRGSSFRKTLLCHQTVDLQRRTELISGRGLYVSSILKPTSGEADPAASGVVEFTRQDKKVSIDHPLSKAALMYLAEIAPRAASLSELIERSMQRVGKQVIAGEEGHITALLGILYQIFTVGHVHLHLEPPELTTVIGGRPRASLLARQQIKTKSMVTNLKHWSVAIDNEPARRFLPLVDGSRTIDQLVSDLQKIVASQAVESAAADGPDEGLPRSGITRDDVIHHLTRLAELSLLEDAD